MPIFSNKHVLRITMVPICSYNLKCEENRHKLVSKKLSADYGNQSQIGQTIPMASPYPTHKSLTIQDHTIRPPCSIIIKDIFQFEQCDRHNNFHKLFFITFELIRFYRFLLGFTIDINFFYLLPTVYHLVHSLPPLLY